MNYSNTAQRYHFSNIRIIWRCRGFSGAEIWRVYIITVKLKNKKMAKDIDETT